jgi:hypothetical protein
MPVEIILLVLLLVAVVALIVIAVLLSKLLKRQQVTQYELTLDPRFTKQIADLGKSVRHHADISAILGIMDKLTEDPTAIERLREYPETVRAALWLHYVKCLGDDLRQAQDELSRVHQARDYEFHGPSGKNSAIVTAQAHIDGIRKKLDAAIAASGQPVGPRAV